MQFRLLLSYLLLATLTCEGSAFDSCGHFTYHHDTTNDGKNFSDALEVKVTPTRAECFSDCFHHRYCNRLLYKNLTGECHLHSSEGSFVSTASDFKYYAAECTISKSVPLPTCSSQFSPFVMTTGLCYDGESWIGDGNGDYTCKRSGWTNSTNDVFPLPAPIAPGFVVTIRGTWDGKTFLEYSLSDLEEDAVISFLITEEEVAGIKQVIAESETTVTINPLPITSGVPFEMQATFNSTHYQVSFDGNKVDTGTLLIRLTSVTDLHIDVEDEFIEQVAFSYP